MVIFLLEVSKQLYRQFSKYLVLHKVLFLVESFSSRIKCAFVMRWDSKQGVPWEIEKHGPHILFNVTLVTNLYDAKWYPFKFLLSLCYFYPGIF